jgi:hypothetical protein
MDSIELAWRSIGCHISGKVSLFFEKGIVLKNSNFLWVDFGDNFSLDTKDNRERNRAFQDSISADRSTALISRLLLKFINFFWAISTKCVFTPVGNSAWMSIASNLHWCCVSLDLVQLASCLSVQPWKPFIIWNKRLHQSLLYLASFQRKLLRCRFYNRPMLNKV